jgi:hypothetical protein
MNPTADEAVLDHVSMDFVRFSLSPSDGERAGVWVISFLPYTVHGEGNSVASTTIETQNPKLKNSFQFIDNVPQPPAQQCPHCLAPFEYLHDGSPVEPNCPKCKAQLENFYGREFERCPACNVPLPPLLPDGLRPSTTCAVCRCSLPNPPTPGPHPPPRRLNPQVCVYCGTPIPWAADGVSRPSGYCAKCYRPLPRAVFTMPRSERVE